MVFWGDNTLKCFVSDEESRDEKYKLFTDRIVVGELFTLYCGNYQRHDSLKKHEIPTPFLVSDWLYFGRTEDLKELFENADIVPQNELADYTYKNSNIITYEDYPLTQRYAPE